MSIEDLGVDVSKTFWEGFWQGFKMLFATPENRMMIAGIIFMIVIATVLGLIIDHFRVRYWTKVRTRARLEEQDKYRKEKQSTKLKETIKK